MKRVPLLVALCVALVGASPAYAGTAGGKLTVSPVDDHHVRLDISVQHHCDASTHCAWFAEVIQVAPSAACSHGESPLWVGPVSESPSADYSSVEEPYGWSDGADQIRLCLYIFHESQYQKLADVLYTPGTTASDETAQPPAQTTPPATRQPLTVSRARAVLPGILRQEFGSRFKRRKHYKRSCARITSEKVRCSVRWDFKRRYRYRGTVTIQDDPDRSDASVLYTASIKHKKLRPKA